MRNLQMPGRSPVHASNAMVATSHPLASGAALGILKDGGNAVDAAIAANAVLAVVEPAMTGIGGDCFVIIREPDGSIHGLNGSGRAASGAHLNWYLERGISDLDTVPAHSITVPGALKAWDTLLQRFGTRDFKSLFAEAISFGKTGFPVASRVGYDWQIQAAKLAKNKAATNHFLVDGKPPLTGQIHRLPALANTLERVANEGIDAFYTGAIAAEIAAAVQAEGGFLSEEDMAGISADWVNPISTNYGGYDIFEIPPNGQGITALIMLNILDALKSRELDPDSAERAHLEMEAGRLAYSVRDTYVADPNAMSKPLDDRVKQVLSQPYTAGLARQFDPDQRNENIVLPKQPDSDTTYLTVVDNDGRAVSFINSLYNGFGSGIVTPDSGIALQNRASCFALIEGHDNAIGPSKRPLHTIIPAMATKNGEFAMSFGVMGGAYQPMGHAHILANIIDYDMDPQEALDHGRMFWDADEALLIEANVSDTVIKGLQSRGHKTRAAPLPLGGGQIVAVDQTNGVLIGASDPRKDGLAIGY